MWRTLVLRIGQLRHTVHQLQLQLHKVHLGPAGGERATWKRHHQGRDLRASSKVSWQGKENKQSYLNTLPLSPRCFFFSSTAKWARPRKATRRSKPLKIWQRLYLIRSISWVSCKKRKGREHSLHKKQQQQKRWVLPKTFVLFNLMSDDTAVSCCHVANNNFCSRLCETHLQLQMQEWKMLKPGV